MKPTPDRIFVRGSYHTVSLKESVRRRRAVRLPEHQEGTEQYRSDKCAVNIQFNIIYIMRILIMIGSVMLYCMVCSPFWADPDCFTLYSKICQKRSQCLPDLVTVAYSVPKLK